MLKLVGQIDGVVRLYYFVREVSDGVCFAIPGETTCLIWGTIRNTKAMVKGFVADAVFYDKATESVLEVGHVDDIFGSHVTKSIVVDSTNSTPLNELTSAFTAWKAKNCPKKTFEIIQMSEKKYVGFER